jgi:hypothetical protein
VFSIAIHGGVVHVGIIHFRWANWLHLGQIETMTAAMPYRVGQTVSNTGAVATSQSWAVHAAYDSRESLEESNLWTPTKMRALFW